MKYFFPTIFILISFLNAYSQEPFGHYVDVNNEVILDYLDHDYNPKKEIYYEYNVRKKYQGGYLYDNQGNKTRVDILGTDFEKKASYKLLGKKYSVKPDDCKGFVIGEDSFAVMKDFGIYEYKKFILNSKNKFVYVMDHIPGYTFYKQGSDNYFFRKDGSDRFLTFPDSYKAFKSFCIENFSDFPEIIDKVENRKIEEDDVKKLIRILEATIKYQQKLKLYYDKYFYETSDKDKHHYYAYIDHPDDSIWYLTYYNKKDQLLYKGGYSDIHKLKRNGIFEWYYPDGTVRKKITYDYGDIKDKKIYYENGKLHYSMVKPEDSDSWEYLEVYNDQGEQLLNNFNGTESFYDKANDRTLTLEFKDKKLFEVFFTDKDGRKIYQLAKNQASLNSLQSINATFTTDFNYIKQFADDGIQGTFLVKMLIDEKGNVNTFDILYSPESRVNPALKSILKKIFMSGNKKWKIAWSQNGDKVISEVIVPISIYLTEQIRTYRYNYYDWGFHWQMQQQMWQMNSLQHIQVPTMPSGF